MSQPIRWNYVVSRTAIGCLILCILGAIMFAARLISISSLENRSLNLLLVFSQVAVVLYMKFSMFAVMWCCLRKPFKWDRIIGTSILFLVDLVIWQIVMVYDGRDYETVVFNDVLRSAMVYRMIFIPISILVFGGFTRLTQYGWIHSTDNDVQADSKRWQLGVIDLLSASLLVAIILTGIQLNNEPSISVVRPFFSSLFNSVIWLLTFYLLQRLRNRKLIFAFLMLYFVYSAMVAVQRVVELFFLLMIDRPENFVGTQINSMSLFIKTLYDQRFPILLTIVPALLIAVSVQITITLFLLRRGYAFRRYA
jgi:hypothetical protein